MTDNYSVIQGGPFFCHSEEAPFSVIPSDPLSSVILSERSESKNPDGECTVLDISPIHRRDSSRCSE